MDNKKNGWVRKMLDKTSDAMASMMKPGRQARKQDNDSVSKIMGKFYPSYTVVGRDTHAKRRKEFSKMYKEKGPKAVIARAKGLTAKFREDNPEYTR